MIVKRPQSKEDFEKYYHLRWKILRKPWNQPKGCEKDELEDGAFHIMVCEDDGTVVGVGRLHFNSENESQIRYMAVEENYRGRGIGKIVLSKLEEAAKRAGAGQIELNARETAVAFYEKAGYEVTEPAHTLFGAIKHFKMIKNVGPASESGF